MKIKGKIKKTFTIAAILFIIYIIYISTTIYLYGTINETAHADVIIVLGASVWENEPSPVFEERIKHGIWLYNNGYADKLIFTGGKGKNSKYSDSSVAFGYAVENGVPAEDIFIEEQSTITQENIFYASQIMERNDMSSVIIVSDPLHMKRAMLMANDRNLTAYSSPTPSTKYVTLKTKLPFLAREVFFYTCYGIYRLFL